MFQINEFVKRARAAKIHAYIISHLRKEMPAMIGKAKTQQRLVDNLEEEFAKVSLLLSVCPFCVKSIPYQHDKHRSEIRYKENFICRRVISQARITSGRGLEWI